MLESIGRPHLAESRLFNRERDDGLLDFRIDAVFEERLLPADLLLGTAITLKNFGLPFSQSVKKPNR